MEVLGKNASRNCKISYEKRELWQPNNQNIEFDMAVAIAEEFDIILEKEEEKILCKRCSDKRKKTTKEI